MKIRRTWKECERYPFLSVRVGEIVDGAGVPVLADAEEDVRFETVLGHDHEVDEESRGRLHHTDLTVRHRDQPIRQMFKEKQNKYLKNGSFPVSGFRFPV